MAWAFKDQEEMGRSQQDEQKQTNAVLTSTAGELGAEASNAPASGSSERPKDEARQPQRAASQVLARNQGKAANPFQFAQTRQALSGARQGIQSEKDQYMANAVAPYQTNQALTEGVQKYAKEGGATPDWLRTFQQASPQALTPFSSKTETNFAPINAMRTNAGVRAYLRNPADPESRSGEQAIDFSLLNADPTFNLQREGVLRDYSDLLNYQRGVEAETPAAARKAQQLALDAYKSNITGTLENEAKSIQDAAKAAEAAYDAQFANLPALRAQIAREEAAKIAAQSPENLRSFIKPVEDDTLSAFFNPLDAASTNPEDFITEDQAGDFNRIMSILGKGGPVPMKGRLAGASAPGRESLRFDEQAYRNLLLNNASLNYQRDQERIAQEREAAEAARRVEENKPKPLPEKPLTVAQPGQLAIDMGDNAYSYPILPELPADQYVYSDFQPAGVGQLAIGLSHGGRVPGQAMVPGDSESNDVVSANLSPGEIVIPRSAAQDKESAKEFIDNMPFGKTRDLLKNKYACGGKVRDNYACGGKVMPKMKGYK